MGMPDPSEVAKVGECVMVEAYDLFCSCGAEDDFCVQLVLDHVVVFGGMNRVIWTPRRGFSLDPSYCTPSFIEAFSEWEK